MARPYTMRLILKIGFRILAFFIWEGRHGKAVGILSECRHYLRPGLVLGYLMCLTLYEIRNAYVKIYQINLKSRKSLNGFDKCRHHICVTGRLLDTTRVHWSIAALFKGTGEETVAAPGVCGGSSTCLAEWWWPGVSEVSRK